MPIYEYQNFSGKTIIICGSLYKNTILITKSLKQYIFERFPIKKKELIKLH